MFEMRLPNYRIGSGIIAESGDILAQFGKRALIIGGEKAMKAALGSVRAALNGAGVEIASVEHYGGECTYGNMRRMLAVAREKNADMIVGIGGGKALDTAKGCADMAGLPVVTYPTIASTCAAITAISVVYDDNSVFVESMFHKGPANYAIIDTDVIAHAPAQYLRAGIGDAMAKHIECAMASRGRELSNSCANAVAVSRVTYAQNLRYGRQAMKDIACQRATDALEQCVLANIVSTGLVSIMIEERYNGELAHALFYGLTNLPDFEKRVLHGDAVGYGMLVQQKLDGQEESFRELHDFFEDIGTPISCRDMGFEWSEDTFSAVLPAAIRQVREARVSPYEITCDMLKRAILQVEADA